ncbi:hypothetical protein DSM25558_2818 [Agrobacterium sp. DSM 25558]|uniref:HEPN/Toprim-associated domain-containing protein n=1 Tax=Agrobacterium sp. DSM 25558 TaxID=1907665 RepID=UPI0009725E82|nr:HEPN/Toprim-associated domain-containing protein [Agrobacterium sp. DSM 25558]SCX20988.1 hypothetical protein DSM25558_2818 [Agrobacterium sp. DSM 25558]
MGTYSDLKIGKFTVEESGNFSTTRHQSIFLPSHSKTIIREGRDDQKPVEVFQAPLRDLVTRLELIGSTLPAIERRFSDPYVTYDQPHDVSFSDALELVRNADLDTIPEFDMSSDSPGILPPEYHDRLRGPNYLGGFSLGPGWDLTSLLERLNAEDMLRVLVERPENLDLMVVWDFMDVVENGYFEREDFTVGSAGQSFLLVTEGTSDTDIIRHAFDILRPEIKDFFRYVDMERNYPFGGHGNLLNFMKGLSSIQKTGGVVAIFDNDAAGVGSLNALARVPDVNAVKLPDLEKFKSFPTIGPNGEHPADINGRAAAIECYLRLPENCRVRWTNFDEKAGEYQGAIDQRGSEKNRQRDEFLRTLATDDYPFENIRKVLEMIVDACTERGKP